MSADRGEAAAHPGALPYEPALDGVRGLAVLAVLLFHGGVSWAVGGYLGVSAFFTLSGFLITSVTLSRREQHGRVDLRDFWVRRARRLLPAAWLCLAGVVIYGMTIAPPSILDTLPGDVLSSLAYLTNWRLVATGATYEALFSAPSPVTHLWSLAIEEQFYLLFPLVAAALLSRGGSPRRLAAVLGVLALASTALMALLHDPSGPTARVYYGTDARIAEILVGAVAAALWWDHRRRRPERRPLGVAVTGAAGLVAVAGLLAWATVPSTSTWLYRGGFLLHALGVVLVVLAVHHPGPLRSALSAAPLRLLGLISYGVYLYHWPLFLVLSEERTGMDGVGLLAVRLGATVVVATLSYVLVEQPIRTQRTLVGGRAALAGALVVALLAGSTVVMGPPPVDSVIAAPPPPVPTTVVVEQPAADGSTSAAPDPAPSPAPTPRVAVFGDSTAMVLAGGLAWWAEASGRLEWGGGVMRLGCGLARDGEIRRLGVPGPLGCEDWSEAWGAWNRDNAIDVAVVFVGPWEVVDRRFDGDDTWRAPGDPTYDAYFRGEVRAALSVLSSTADSVVWLTHPPIDPGRDVQPRPAEPYAESDPARMARVNEMIEEEVARWPGEVAHVVDLAGYFDELPLGPLDPEYRPDGVHISIHLAPHVANWLGPRITAACCDGAGGATSAATPPPPAR